MLQHKIVARSTRAWIETVAGFAALWATIVARSTRAWIETRLSLHFPDFAASHALRVRGLKLNNLQELVIYSRRTLYACVD